MRHIPCSANADVSSASLELTKIPDMHVDVFNIRGEFGQVIVENSNRNEAAVPPGSTERSAQVPPYYF